MTTPMMAQWQACKEKAKDALLLFRLGDFYEAFEGDAAILSKELDLVLTKRHEIPMAGIPFHACEAYIDRLIAKGYRVAIAEQMEDPKETKGIVQRDIVRVITPGTLIDLEDKRSQFIASLCQVGAVFGLAILDITTADFRVQEFEELRLLLDEISRLKPRELLLSDKCKIQLEEPVCITSREGWHFNHQLACEALCKQFGVLSLDGFGLKGMTAAINAAGALLTYLLDDLNLSLPHLRQIRAEASSQFMALDRTTERHLELAALFSFLDKTSTPMGGRLLREWLLHPLLDPAEIRKRQDRVEALLPQRAMKDLLCQVRDLERLIMRIETGYASPRDLSGLKISLEPLPRLSLLLEQLGEPPLPDLAALTSKLAGAVVDAPPLRLSDGGIFRPGYHSGLDDLHLLKSDNQAWMLAYQARLREETQIKTLKVGYTQVFGYYIEVSRGQSEKMPERFQRRQTLVNAERYLSPELKEYEHKILTAEAQIAALELELFHNLRREIAAHAEPIRKAARAIAETDALLSLAEVAVRHRFVRPLVDDSDLYHVIEGRHPIVESSLPETFVPNDVHLDKDERLLVLTGPNMAGKSTYIRQVALISILAQIGSFVPAKKAHLGIIDKLFSRIGASDDLARGQSTFMVEMAETANILNNATDRSLVLLDEIGRGTSTYDGIAIAWAVAEYLLTTPGRCPKTLFATHYWELNELAGKIAGAANYNVAVHESEEGIVFLRKIVRGGTDKSYGIHVARLAGLPPSVIACAQQRLAHLQETTPPKRPAEKQLELF